MVDLRQSTPYARYIQRLGWIVEDGIFIRKLGIFGAIAKIQRTNLPKNWREITKKHHVWMTKWEPCTTPSPPPKLGGGTKGGGTSFYQDSWPLLASKTLRVDLTLAKEKIFEQFKKDCRYCIRRSQRLAFRVQKDNFEGFYKLWKKAAGIKKLWIPPYKDYLSLIGAFGKNVNCLTVDDQAGALILIYDKTAYYYYAAALPIGKKHYLQYYVVWELMKLAKKLGCKVWDFEGIYDQRWPNKDWKGFSHFKKSFGGEEIEFPGSFTKWL